MSRLWNIAVLGATGLVGETLIKVLEERDFPVGELFPLASSRSLGKGVAFRGRERRQSIMKLKHVHRGGERTDCHARFATLQSPERVATHKEAGSHVGCRNPPLAPSHRHVAAEPHEGGPRRQRH